MGGAEEVDHLVELLAACDHVLPDLGEGSEELALVIRETCEAIERRLANLGVVADAP